MGAEHATAAAASIPTIAAAARTAWQLTECLVMGNIYRGGPTSRVPVVRQRTFSPAVLLPYLPVHHAVAAPRRAARRATA